MGLLAQMTWGQWLVGMALLGVCCLLILVVLLQRGRGGGLAGAFGGGGGSSAFGAKTGDVFTWITVVVATIFVGLSVAANFVFDDSAPPRAATTVQTTVPLEPPPSDSTPAPAPQGVAPAAPAGAGTTAPGAAGGGAGAAKPGGTSDAPPAGDKPKDAPPTPAP